MCLPGVPPQGRVTARALVPPHADLRASLLLVGEEPQVFLHPFPPTPRRLSDVEDDDLEVLLALNTLKFLPDSLSGTRDPFALGPVTDRTVLSGAPSLKPEPRVLLHQRVRHCPAWPLNVS